MFHTANISVSRGRGANLHTFFGLVHPAGKKPFKRGALFGTISGILLVIGVILTCLAGLTDVVGGPLLISVGLLLLLISMRQFFLARKHHLLNQQTAEQLSTDTAAAMVTEQEQDDGAVTVIMDTLTPEEMFSCSNDCEPPSYCEATESCLNNSVVLPEEVNIENEDPPSYAEALEDSCPTLDWIDPQFPSPNHEWAVPRNSNNTGHSNIQVGSYDTQGDPKGLPEPQSLSAECIIEEDENEALGVEDNVIANVDNTELTDLEIHENIEVDNES